MANLNINGNLKITNQNLNDFVIQQETLPNGNWYRIWKSGRMEQGGFVTQVVANSLTSATITLPMPYSNSNYQVLLTEIKNNNTTNDTATGGQAVYQRTSSTFTIATYSWTNGRFWQTSGIK